MTLGFLDDSHYYETQDGLGVVPVFLLAAAGGAAATAAIATALNTGWSTTDYDYWMRYMDSTIKEWDALGWAKGCWRKYPAERTRWLAFWGRFSALYKEGLMSKDLYLLDKYENTAKLLLGDLRDWSVRLNTLCAAGTTAIGPSPTDPDAPPKSPTDSITDILKWGTYAVAAVIGLNLVTAFKPRR
jgi:hypothetical protein